MYARNDYRSQKDFFAALNNQWTDRNGEGMLHKLVDELGLIDVWRTLPPSVALHHRGGDIAFKDSDENSMENSMKTA